MADDKTPKGRDDLRSSKNEDGLEIESDKVERIAHPFNPELIKIRTVNVNVGQIITRIEHDEIDLAPDFQRLRGIWKTEQKSRLIESLLLRIPIPIFYVAADKDEKWAVVDGIQRFSTIYGYRAGEFPLSGLEYLDHDGKKFDTLSRHLQRRIDETQIVVNVIEPGTPEEVKFNIFYRLNTGGVPLNGQEIRHALNPGPVRAFLKELAKSKEFQSATDRSIGSQRMADRECILRFLAFHIDPWEKYAVNDINGYLGDAMKEINKKSQPDRDAIAADFKRAMRAAGDIFGKQAFRKIYTGDDRRRPVNRALFGAWGVGLARRSPQEIDILVRNRRGVRERFMSLLESDQEFESVISYSTSAPQRVRKQFRAIDDLIAKCA